MSNGSLVKLKNACHLRYMTVLHTKGRAVCCEWEYGGETYRDSFCCTSLMVVDSGPK